MRHTKPLLSLLTVSMLGTLSCAVFVESPSAPATLVVESPAPIPAKQCKTGQVCAGESDD